MHTQVKGVEQPPGDPAGHDLAAGRGYGPQDKEGLGLHGWPVWGKMFSMDTLQGHDWPPRSPELNPLDFFCWGILNQKVFLPKPTSMQQLKARIRQEVFNPDWNMIRRTCADLTNSCHIEWEQLLIIMK